MLKKQKQTVVIHTCVFRIVESLPHENPWNILQVLFGDILREMLDVEIVYLYVLVFGM